MEAQLNAVLGRLDPRREKELFAALMPIEFKAAQALQDAGSIPNYCYFPVSGLVSLVAKDEHDQTIESASIGSTGAINLSAVSYNAASLVSAVAQLPVRAFRAPTTIVRRAARESVAVQQAVFLAQAHLLEHAQLNLVCTSFHNASQRLARWLLRASGYSSQGTLETTQDFVSKMLGCTRPTLSGAASALLEARIITYRRGRITIHERVQLENRACSCYLHAAKLDGQSV